MLFSGLERRSGIRRFGEEEVRALKLIDCLKKSGLEIRDIRRFMDWCKEGAASYPQRLELFVRQSQKVSAEIRRMEQVQDMLRYKCWYYEQLLAGAAAEELPDPTNGKMPPEICRVYTNAFAEAET